MSSKELINKLNSNLEEKYDGLVFEMDYLPNCDMHFHEIEHEEAIAFIHYLKDNTDILKNKEIALETKSYEVIFDEDGNLTDVPYTVVKNVGILSDEDIKNVFKFFEEYLDKN